MTLQHLADQLIRKLMLLRPVYPDLDQPRSGPRVYVNPDLALEEAAAVYADEQEYPFDNYFGHQLDLRGASALDLGCYCGGRAVAWAERYGLSSVAGTDVNPAMMSAANDFAKAHGVRAEFKQGTAEQIPFRSGCFDVILTFDVLEHVTDVGKALAECFRVLKPGGRMYVVFPQFLHPVEHHLSQVTRTPYLHYLFSGKSLVRVYCDMIRERGESAAWYARAPEELAAWEKGHTINGTSIAAFDGMVVESGFETLERIDPPLLAVGRKFGRSTSKSARVARTACAAAARLRFLRELTTHRIARTGVRSAKPTAFSSESGPCRA